MAGFEVTLHGRIWVTPEGENSPALLEHLSRLRIHDLHPSLRSHISFHGLLVLMVVDSLWMIHVVLPGGHFCYGMLAP